MATKEELLAERKEYEKKYKETRNIQDKAIFSGKIKRIDNQLKKLDEKPLVKDYVPNKDVPSVADKANKSRREVVRGMITGTEGIRVDI